MGPVKHLDSYPVKLTEVVFSLNGSDHLRGTVANENCLFCEVSGNSNSSANHLCPLHGGRATRVTERWQAHPTPQKAFPEGRTRSRATGFKIHSRGPQNVTVPSGSEVKIWLRCLAGCPLPTPRPRQRKDSGQECLQHLPSQCPLWVSGSQEVVLVSPRGAGLFTVLHRKI